MKYTVWAILLLCLCGTWAQAQTPAELRTRAAAGDSTAWGKLSEYYQFGLKGVKANEDSAHYFLKKGAQAGDPGALFLLGVQETASLYDAKTFASGVKNLEKAADRGSVDAMLRLSWIWRTRDGESAQDAYYDPAKGLKYAENAAGKGNTEAMLLTAQLLTEGKNTTRQRDSAAVIWLRRAALEKKSCEAQIRMGDMAFAGRISGKVEPFEALHWYRMAFANPVQNIEQKSRADVGIHRVDQVFKEVHNLMLESTGMLPPGTLAYRLRAE